MTSALLPWFAELALRITSRNLLCILLVATPSAPCLSYINLPAGPEPFFQRCEVQPFVLTINYRPHRVDLAALSR